MNEIASAKADELIATKLAQCISDDEAFDVGEEMVKLALTSMSKISHDYDITREEVDYFIQERDIAKNEFIGNRGLLPIRDIFGFIIPARRRANEARDNLEIFAKKSWILGAQESPTRGILIESLVESDTERAADLIMNYLGSIHTVRFSLAAAFEELAQNSHEQTKLVKSGKALGRNQDVSKSAALRMIVKETSRLFPVATKEGIERVIEKDFTSDDGCLIPAKSLISIPFFLAMSDPRTFENPNSWNLSRWVYATEEMNLVFQPFGAGANSCLGVAVANAAINNVIARICSQHKLELVEEGTVEFNVSVKLIKTMIKVTKL